MDCGGNAPSIPQILAAMLESWRGNQILSHSSLSFKKLSRLWAICASSCQSFIVSWTLLSSSGAWWRNTFGTAVIIHLKPWRRTFQRHWSWFHSRQFRSGSIMFFGGWRLTEVGWELKMHRIRWRNSAPKHTLHIGVFLRQLPTLLIMIEHCGSTEIYLFLAQFHQDTCTVEAGTQGNIKQSFHGLTMLVSAFRGSWWRDLWLPTKLALDKYFNLLNFDAIENPSEGSFLQVKRIVFLRGIRNLAIFEWGGVLAQKWWLSEPHHRMKKQENKENVSNYS